MKHLLQCTLIFALIVSFNRTKAQTFTYPGSFDSDGVPNYLVSPDEIDAHLLNTVHAALPDAKPVPVYNPSYIANTVETDIHLYKQADVWITFVSEYAGWKNSLGFYTYPLNAPPENAGAINYHVIIFPNVSMPNGGGGLKPGSKVKIGNFPANTGIGWFLVADGWRNNQVSGGNYILYSNPAFNAEADPSLRAHTVLLHSAGTDKFILGFEDTKRDKGSDNDFNDVLFYVTANPFDAINKTDIVSIGDTTTATIPEENDAANNNPESDSNTTNTTFNTHISNKNTINMEDGEKGNNNASATNSNSAINNNGDNNSNVVTTNNVNTNTTTNNNNSTTIINNTTIVNNGNANNNNAETNQDSENDRSHENREHQNSDKHYNDAENSSGIHQSMTVCTDRGVSEKDFDSMYKLVQRKPLESSRVELLKQAVRGKRIVTQQAIRLLKLLTLGRDRLEMAKYLFDYTCDKTNYYQLSSAFRVSTYEKGFSSWLAGKDLSDDNNYISSNTSVYTTSYPSSDYHHHSSRDHHYAHDDHYSNHHHSSRDDHQDSDFCKHDGFSNEAFASFKNSISSKSFSSSMKTVLKQGVQDRCLTVSQVQALLGLFSFESNKLELAKYLYDFTTDKKNYYKVNDSFSFSSSIEDLNKYLAGRK